MNTLEIIIHVNNTRDTTLTNDRNRLREIRMCHPLENHHVGVRNADILDVPIFNDTTEHIVTFIRLNDRNVKTLRLHLLSGPNESVTTASLRVGWPHDNLHAASPLNALPDVFIP